MNHAIIVAGGIGVRTRLDIPKQYVEVNGLPIIMYSFRKFARNPLIDTIVFVIANEWKSFVENKLKDEQYRCEVLFAEAGESRQHSVYNGLRALKGKAKDEDITLIHDAVRPLFPESIIQDGISACNEYDVALPVVSVKDATYRSSDGVVVTSLLPRSELYAGQTPESFVYRKYLDAHSNLTNDEIANIRGSSELAYRAGLSVKLIPGSERNFKITTIEDLHYFELISSLDA